jgi:hypothetical protein
MKTRKIAVVLGVLCLGLLAAAQKAAPNLSTAVASNSAAVPRLVQYSGTAAGSDGKALRGIVGITFLLYKDQQGGAPLWLETQNVQADSKGAYSVLLGSTKADGLPVDLFTSGEARWLGVEPHGQSEQPRVLLVSAPYALKAADAETLGGKPASVFLQVTSGNTNGTNSAAMSEAAFANSQPIIHGSGKTNFIPVWKSKTTLGDSALFQTGGNVGIGTTTPSAPLDVKGNATIEGNQNVTGSVGIGAVPGSFQLQVTAPAQLGELIQGPVSGVGAGLDLQTTGMGGKGWEILATGKSAAQGVNKLNIRDLSIGVDVFTIAPGGLIGVGTVNPASPLDVEANSSAASIIGSQLASSAGDSVMP